MSPDDLKPGMWITLSAKPAQPPKEYEFWVHAPPPIPCPLAGIPMRVVAISLPWLVCADVLGNANRFDVRDVLIFKASPSYVRFTKAFAAKKEGAVVVRDPNGCPKCGGKMRQRCKDGVWASVCGQCGE